MSQIHYTRCTKCKQYAVLNVDGKVVGCEHCAILKKAKLRPSFEILNQNHYGNRTAQVVPQ